MTDNQQQQSNQDQQQGEKKQAGPGSTAGAQDKKKRSLADAIAARGIPVETWRAVCSSIFPGANPDSVLLAFDYCKARKLDIMKKPCHIVAMKVKDARTNIEAYRDVIMQSVGELRSTAFRTGDYAGKDKPVLGPIMEFEFGDDADPKKKQRIKTHSSVEIVVYRLDREGNRQAYPHTEYFIEACATKKGGHLNAMWTRRPIGQLTKCAEAGALRAAFPEELGNTYTLEEMEGRTIIVNEDQEIVRDKKTAGAAGIIAALEQQEAERLPVDLGEESQAEPVETAGLKKALSELNTAQADGPLSEDAQQFVKDMG